MQPDNRDEKIIAKKSLGQNFIKNKNVLERICSFVNPTENDKTIVEIGPGLGTLTEVLLNKFMTTDNPKKSKILEFIAIEKDHRLIPNLQKLIEKYENSNLIYSDALDCSYEELIKDKPAIVIGNLPYNVSTAILMNLITKTTLFSKFIFMFQKEVADRITAKVGTKDYGKISVLTQFLASPKKLITLPPDVFHPKPKIFSTLVEIKINNFCQEIDSELISWMLKILDVTFSQRRKVIKTGLSKLTNNNVNIAEKILIKAKIDPKRRAETLSPNEFLLLTKEFLEQKNQFTY